MKKKGTPKADWLAGDRQRIESDAIREAMAACGFELPAHEIEEHADKIRLNSMEQAARRPEDVLEHGKWCLRDIKKVVNPHRKLLGPDLRKKLCAYFIKKRGLSAKEADRETDAIEVRARLTLRCMRDAWGWLHKAHWALKAGRGFIADGKTAKDEQARIFACGRAAEEFARAISFAFYAGVECGELKARASFDEKFGSNEKSKRKGRFSKLREVTFREYARLVAAGLKPTNDALRDAVAQPNNKITYRDGCFRWRAAHGRKKKTSDKTWEKIATKARKASAV